MQVYDHNRPAPVFHNEENPCHELPDGKKVWDSRSVAVTCIILCVHEGDLFVLMGERGPNLDHPHKWCIICGYLDRNETLTEAVKREVYEEAAFDIDALDPECILYEDLKMPHDIESSPKSNRQNISTHYGVVFKGARPLLPQSQAILTGEMLQMEWVRLSAILTNEEIQAKGVENLYAFGHNEQVHKFVRLMVERGVLSSEVLKQGQTA